MALPGILPRRFHASQTAFSTASHSSILRRSLQIAPISGRVYRSIKGPLPCIQNVPRAATPRTQATRPSASIGIDCRCHGRRVNSCARKPGQESDCDPFTSSARTRDGARVDEAGADRTLRRVAPRHARSSWSVQTGEVTHRQSPANVYVHTPPGFPRSIRAREGTPAFHGVLS